MIDDQIISAARRVLDGDESRKAAAELEAAILESGADDERWRDLLEALALYAPGSGSPYYEPPNSGRQYVERSRSFLTTMPDVRAQGATAANRAMFALVAMLAFAWQRCF